jgi:hypothetical protein
MIAPRIIMKIDSDKLGLFTRQADARELCDVAQ